MKSKLTYGGFWVRLLAWTLDLIILMVLLLVPMIVFSVALSVVSVRGGNFSPAQCQTIGFWFGLFAMILLKWLYFTIMESSRLQATMGKKILHLKVTDIRGKRISFGRANARYWSKMLSTLFFSTGFVMIGVSQLKQGLHDRIAKTFVVRTEPGESEESSVDEGNAASKDYLEKITPTAFFEVWFHPRKVVRTIIATRPGYCVWAFILTYAVLQAFLPEDYVSFLGQMPLGITVLIGILFSLLLDVTAFVVLGGLTYQLGKWLGGKGSWEDMEVAYAWAYPPALIGILFMQSRGLPVWFQMIAGETDSRALLLQPHQWWQILFQGISAILTGWTILLWIINISEAHKLSIPRSIGIVVLVFIPIVLLTIGFAVFIASRDFSGH